MNALKKLSILCLGGLFGASLQAQQYLDNALYVKLKESSPVSAKSMGRKTVPLSSLGLKITQAKNNKFGLHQEARSMSLFNNPVLDKTFSISFDSTTQIDKLIRALENDPNVEYVERVRIYETYGILPEHKEGTKAVPDDPYYQPVGEVDFQWYLKQVNAEGAWDIQASGSPNIIAAVVDGAIWAEHPELNIPTERQHNAGTGTEGNSNPPSTVTQNETCDALYSENPDVDPCPSYSWSHGTHCAGVVGATKNNGEGIASLASGVTLLAVAAHLPQYSEAVVGGDNGIVWAAEHGARVISCSWGSTSLPSRTEEAILKECYDSNIVVVAAAGNDNISSPHAPATSPHVISVGSVDEDGGKSSFSNYGNWVHITAPGGTASRENNYAAIFSTTFCQNQYTRLYHSGLGDPFAGEYYDEMSGTSMATPLVASLCALMLSYDSTLTPGEIKDILQNTSSHVSSNSQYFTPLAGTIDAAAALQAVQGRKYDAPVQNLTVTDYTLDSLWLDWDAPSGNTHDILSYNIYKNGVLLDSMWSAENTSYIDTTIEGGMTTYMVSVNYSDGYTSIRKEAQEDIPNIYTVEVFCTPRNAGTVTGAGRYAENARAALRAYPDSGYVFRHWYGQGGVLSTRDYYEVVVRENVSIDAIFAVDPSDNEELLAEETRLAPNPVREILEINSPAAIETLSVFDLQGRKLKEMDGNNQNDFQMNASFLSEGTYVLELRTNMGTIKKKFVKL